MAFDREIDAFRAYFKVFPESSTLLLDTYDTINAARLATEFGPKLRGVRLDSGDLLELSKQARAILDEAGMRRTKIFASGDLNEFKIAELIAAGAAIDLFGVGTDLSTSRDAPALGGVYKLVEIDFDGRVSPKMKLSRDKATYPYSKQVWRTAASDGSYAGDVIAKADETDLQGAPLLELVMRDGVIAAPLPGVKEAQERARRQLAALPSPYRRLIGAQAYPVRYSDRLEQGRRELLREFETQRCVV
jgi:nicotinate phosphoribosyltransferase